MNKIKELINRIRIFFTDPQRKKLVLLIFVLAIIPLTVIAALTVQNLQQRAGLESAVRISDSGGNTLASTYDPNVFIDVNFDTLPNWVLPSKPSASNNLIKNAYAVGLGKFCTISSQCDPGLKCGNFDEEGFGQCVSSASTPTPTPTPDLTLTPIPTPTILFTPTPASVSVPINSSAELPSSSTLTPTPTPTPTSVSTPNTPNILRSIYIENKDTDGSTGGSAPVKITVNSGADIAHVPWKLNDLLPGQNQASRIVQVTLFSDNEISLTLTSTVVLARLPGLTLTPTSILSVSPSPIPTAISVSSLNPSVTTPQIETPTPFLSISSAPSFTPIFTPTQDPFPTQTPPATALTTYGCGDKCSEEPAIQKGVDTIAYCAVPLTVAYNDLDSVYKNFKNAQNNKDKKDNRYFVFVSKTSDEIRKITIENLNNVTIEPLIGNTNPFAGEEMLLDGNTPFVVHGNPDKNGLLDGCLWGCKEKQLELRAESKKIKMYPTQDCSALSAVIAQGFLEFDQGEGNASDLEKTLLKVVSKATAISAKVVSGRPLTSADIASIEDELRKDISLGELKSVVNSAQTKAGAINTITDTLRTAENSPLKGNLVTLNLDKLKLNPSLVQGAGTQIGGAYSNFSSLMKNPALQFSPILKDYAKETDNGYLLLAAGIIDRAKLSSMAVGTGLSIKSIVQAALSGVGKTAILKAGGSIAATLGKGYIFSSVLVSSGTTLYCALNNNPSLCGCRVGSDYDGNLVLELEKDRVKKGETINYRILGFEDCPNKLGLNLLSGVVNLNSISAPIVLGKKTINPFFSGGVEPLSGYCKFQANGRWCLGEFNVKLNPGAYDLLIGQVAGTQIYFDPKQKITVQ